MIENEDEQKGLEMIQDISWIQFENVLAFQHHKTLVQMTY